MIQKIKKHMRLVIGIVLLLVGIGFMVVPFIPIGYIFIFIAFIFLATYVPPINRFMDYMKTKDKKGRLDKVEDKVEDFNHKFDEKGEDNGNKKEDKTNQEEKNEGYHPKDKPT